MLCHNQVLHHLCVSNCSDWITDKELLPVIGQNQHLLRVDLRGCVHLSRHALVAVSLSCPRLQHLSLAHCEWVDSLALRSLADHCSDLRSLDVTACRQLKDDAVCYLAGSVRRYARSLWLLTPTSRTPRWRRWPKSAESWRGWTSRGACE